MKYLKSKPGSLEAAAGQVSGFATEQEYQKMFKKELDKAGKGIASMSDQEKKNFFNKIDKMYKAKNEITAAIKRVGETPELKEAIDMVNSEITAKEKELQSTFVAEKKSKNYYLNNGYVEGTLSANIKGLKKGSEVMVNAEEYASLGDEELIDVVNPKTDKSTYVRKDELSVKL